MEDSDLVRDELERLVRELPGVRRVAAVAGVAEALRELAGAEFDTWLLDFDLGDGTALELLEERPGDGEGDGPVVFVVTNHASSSLRERCLAAGADGFFDKSAGLDEMLVDLAGRAPGARSA